MAWSGRPELVRLAFGALRSSRGGWSAWKRGLDRRRITREGKEEAKGPEARQGLFQFAAPEE